MIDYSDLYNKLVKNWPGITKYINKNDIISKTKSKEQNYNPNRNTKKFSYMAIVMKSFIMCDYNKKLDRNKNRKIKLKKLGIY